MFATVFPNWYLWTTLGIQRRWGDLWGSGAYCMASEKHEKLKTKKHIKGNDIKRKLVHTTLAVLGIISSCPRVTRWSDDDAMLEILNPTTSVHQTPYYCCWKIVFLVSCRQKKETRLSNIPPKVKLKDKWKTHLFKHSKNIKMPTQKCHNQCKSDVNLWKTQKLEKRKHKIKGKTT